MPIHLHHHWLYPTNWRGLSASIRIRRAWSCTFETVIEVTIKFNGGMRGPASGFSA